MEKDSTNCASDRVRAGIALMIFGAFCLVIMAAMAKLGMQQLPFWEVIFFRSSIMLLLVLPYALWRGISLIGNNPLLVLNRGVVGFLGLTCNFYAIKHLPLANARILLETSVFFVAVLAGLFLKEKIGFKLLACVIAGFTGAGMILKPQAGALDQASLLGLASGLCTGITMVSIRKLHETDSFSTIIIGFGFCGMLGSYLVGYQSFTPVAADLWPLLAAIGLFGTAGQVCVTYSFKFGPASLIAPFLYSGVIFSLLFDVLVWGTWPDTWSSAGMLIMMVSGAILAMRRQIETGA